MKRSDPVAPLWAWRSAGWATLRLVDGSRYSHFTHSYVLQDCRLYSNVRQSIWRERVDMHTKLYGPLPELEKTVAFIAQAGIGIWRERWRTRRRRRRRPTRITQYYIHQTSWNTSLYQEPVSAGLGSNVSDHCRNDRHQIVDQWPYGLKELKCKPFINHTISRFVKHCWAFFFFEVGYSNQKQPLSAVWPRVKKMQNKFFFLPLCNRTIT